MAFLILRTTNINRTPIHKKPQDCKVSGCQDHLCILFLKRKYNVCIIYMGSALAELCLLLGNKTPHSQVGYIGHGCGRLFRKQA